MPTETRKKTDDVLASARKDLQAQLAVVRGELSRLAAEENALAQALSSLDGDGALASTAPTAAGSDGAPKTKSSPRRNSAGKARTSRRRRRAASKSTADRVDELRGLLADGPKSRSDLAAALKVSPARVQQLLAELGGSVSSQPSPEPRQGKLWTLTNPGNGSSAAKPIEKRSSGRAKARSTRKSAAPPSKQRNSNALASPGRERAQP
jgi:hypothetical protein